MLRIDFSLTSLKYLFSLTSEGHVAPHGSEGTQTGTWTGEIFTVPLATERALWGLIQHCEQKFKSQHYHLLKPIRYSLSTAEKQ